MSVPPAAGGGAPKTGEDARHPEGGPGGGNGLGTAHGATPGTTGGTAGGTPWAVAGAPDARVVARPFPDAAREALADERLRANLRRATQTIRARRAGAVAELPDFEELREEARAIKAGALDRLDELLAQFAAAVEAAGGHIHHAADAAAANAIVAGVAHRHGVTELVKMKSLTTDEIGLDAALAAAGVEAVETDLAELIVQLAGDTASHILVPAIHYSRGEVRDLFRRTIAPGADLADDPRELAEVSRLYLRERFLRARMGVTGVNFGVAETGTICLVENEGNGRMCVTLPPVLVSIMGIEKLLPRLDDLALFLRLLPRSATGERISAYTSLITGVTAGDGPREFHVVLLDNGRRNVLADPVGRQALQCIRCGACLNVCPVYSRVGGHAYGSIYPGPIGAILTPQLWGIDRHASLPFASTLCGVCTEVCPVKIDIPAVLLHLRARAVREQAPALERAAFGAAAVGFAGPRRFALGQRLARAAELPLERDGLVRRLPGPLAGWTRGRDLRPVAGQTFREWWARERGSQSDPRRADAQRGRAGGGDDCAGGEVRAGADAASTAPAVAGLSGASPAESSPAGSEALRELFRSRLADQTVEVRLVASGEVDRTVAGVCAERGLRRLGAPAGLPPEWRPAGVEVVEDHGLTPAELDALDGVITGCTLAIAETGTLVLTAAPTDGRRALTLIPDTFVCIVDADRIVADLPAAMPAIARIVRDGHRPLTFVSGPSATSDIELQHVQGVHGPRQLVVLLVTDSRR